QIVGLPRVKAKQLAQRPLQEQKRDQGQCKPLGGRHQIADEPIEAAQEDHVIAAPLIIGGSLGWGGRDRTSEWRNQNPLPYRLATPQQGRLEAAGTMAFPLLSQATPVYRRNRAISTG